MRHIMIKHINNNAIAMTILFLIFLFCYGCSSALSNKVVINRQFLYEIERAFQQEEKKGKDKCAIYNQIWKNNYYELIYLVTIGDQKAIDISISLIGQKEEALLNFDEIELLVRPTFEGSFGETDYDYFWKTLEKKKYNVQINALHLFDIYKPVDWDIKSYFTKHPEIKKLYEAKYSKLEIYE